jgi:hypothetical protein
METGRQFIMSASRRCFRGLIFAIYAMLLAGVDARGGDTTPALDPDRGVVLPSALADGFFKQHRANVILQVDEWQITPDELSLVDGALATALKEERIGQGLPALPHYYRQYLPGRLRQSRIVFVNGFVQTESEMFPDREIPADRWRHQLVVAYGGGCGFWYGVYIVDESRFLVLDHKNANGRRIICNGPK